MSENFAVAKTPLKGIKTAVAGLPKCLEGLDIQSRQFMKAQAVKLHFHMSSHKFRTERADIILLIYVERDIRVSMSGII